MQINDTDIKQYKARKLNIDIQSASFTNKADTVKALLPSFASNEVNLNTITVSLLLDTADKRDNYLQRSNLLSVLTKPVDLYFEDRSLTFKAILVNHKNTPSITHRRSTLELTFLAYCYFNTITVQADRVKEKEINVAGNIDAAAIIKITPIVDIVDITLEGLSDDSIKIKNLKKNKTVIINAEDSTVIEDGHNKFTDTEMWEFPKVKVGTNLVKFSRTDCNITIEYKPRYI